MRGSDSQKYDREYFTRMYTLYYTPLVTYLLQFTNDLTDAEDFAQASFVMLWDKRLQLKISGSFKSYLFSVGYNLFIDTMRKQRKQDLLMEQLKKESLDDLMLDDEELFTGKLLAVEAAIDDLPEKCREIFMMHKKDGLPYKTIAERLQISLKTVESQMRIAMIKIREQIKGQ